MAIEVGKVGPREIDFSYQGKALAVRKLPLRLGLKMQTLEEDSLSPDIVAEVISECVVYKNGKTVWSIDEVLELDLQPMLKLFSEVSGTSFSAEDAEKN